MQDESARALLDALAKGFDPSTGELLPPESVVQQPGIRGALQEAIAALEERAARAARRPSAANVGQPWSPQEEHELLLAYAAGTPLGELAQQHKRSLTAIEARLEKLGKITAEQRVTRNRFNAKSNGEAQNTP